MADEVGRMLGGWLKHDAAAAGSGTAAGALAVRFGETRLIDNLLITPS